MLLAPSILSANFARLGEEVNKIHGSDFVHVDVMDGHFVPNISFGAAVMKSLAGQTDLKFDVHLMIENPDQYLEDFITPQTEYICVHQEACTHLDRTLNHIKEKGIKAGVALNPASPIALIDDVLDLTDMVLIMSVNPGFGGQKFIGYTLDKIKKLDAIRKERKLSFAIEVDGGITLSNVEDVIEAGADIIVAGSAVFNSDNVEETVNKFKQY